MIDTLDDRMLELTHIADARGVVASCHQDDTELIHALLRAAWETFK